MTKIVWPELELENWEPTKHTLHMWTQIVGKIRMEQTPWFNHSWHVTLYVTTRGLTTGTVPHGSSAFQIDFDFVDHQLIVLTADGRSEVIALRPRSVADFYARVMTTLKDLGMPVEIHTMPSEIPDATPFDEDESNASYDADYARRFWTVLIHTQRVMQRFRARFLGKCSPIQFFWGSFDLAVSRFSGRDAPPHPGGFPNFPDWVAREAYSHETCSAAFWPGGEPHPFPFYYSYIYPAAEGYSEASVEPTEAFFSEDLGEFVLPYESVRKSDDPDATLLAFFQSSYAAAADAADWDRQRLERDHPPGPGFMTNG